MEWARGRGIAEIVRLRGARARRRFRRGTRGAPCAPLLQHQLSFAVGAAIDQFDFVDALFLAAVSEEEEAGDGEQAIAFGHDGLSDFHLVGAAHLRRNAWRRGWFVAAVAASS